MADEFDHLKAAKSCLQDLGRDDLEPEAYARHAIEATAYALVSIASDVRAVMVAFVVTKAFLEHGVDPTKAGEEKSPDA